VADSDQGGVAMNETTTGRLRRLSAKAPGLPWVEEDAQIGYWQAERKGHVAAWVGLVDCYAPDPAVADFVVAAVNALPLLLDVAEAVMKWNRESTTLVGANLLGLTSSEEGLAKMARRLQEAGE